MKRFLPILALILLLSGLSAGAVAWYNPTLAHQVTVTVTSFLGLGPEGADTERYNVNEIDNLLDAESSIGETITGATNIDDADSIEVAPDSAMPAGAIPAGAIPTDEAPSGAAPSDAAP